MKKIVAGVKREEITGVESKSLADFISSSYPFYMDPMPNLYFTRDPGACVGNGINIHHMSTATRRREALLLKYMFLHNRDFAPEGSQIWYDYDHEYSIEGGDVLVLNAETVAIGLSQRTTACCHRKIRRKYVEQVHLQESAGIRYSEEESIYASGYRIYYG